MKTRLTLFQIIVLGIFGVFAVGGMVYFATGSYGSSASQIGEVLIWGTLDDRSFNAVVRALAEDDQRLQKVIYEEKDARTFRTDLSEAIANGRGPDLYILSHDNIMKDEGKIVPFPLVAENGNPLIPVAERTFRDTFIDGAELFLTPSGTLGIPIAVDPLVLYYNRDLLATAGFAAPPKTWNEVFDIAEKVTRKNEAKTITKSGVAFGEYENVSHAREIIATLMLQAGSPITERDDQGRVRPAVAASALDVVQPVQSALRFYTEFANPAKTVYSWNRALPESRVAFGNGDVGLYVGFAGELPLIRAQNPNLNFGISVIPQIKETSRAVTYGRIYAFSVPRGSLNPVGAAQVAFVLAQSNPSQLLAQAAGIPSPRRDVLAARADGNESIFRDSAIISHGWLDPDPDRSGVIFRGMIEGATSGGTRLSEATQRMERELSTLLDN